MIKLSLNKMLEEQNLPQEEVEPEEPRKYKKILIIGAIVGLLLIHIAPNLGFVKDYKTYRKYKDHFNEQITLIQDIEESKGTDGVAELLNKSSLKD